MRYQSIGYNIFVKRQSSCLVVSSFTVLFNRMPVGRGSDSMIGTVWGYNINIMRQFAWLKVNPITVDNFASLLKCTAVVQASDLMTDLT